MQVQEQVQREQRDDHQQQRAESIQTMNETSAESASASGLHAIPLQPNKLLARPACTEPLLSNALFFYAPDRANARASGRLAEFTIRLQVLIRRKRRQSVRNILKLLQQ